MAAGKTNHVWTLAEIVGLLDYKFLKPTHYSPVLGFDLRRSAG